MPRFFDPIERLPLACGALIVEITIDEFDRLGQPARGFGLPDLPVASRTDTLNERVSSDGIGGVWREWRHGVVISLVLILACRLNSC